MLLALTEAQKTDISADATVNATEGCQKSGLSVSTGERAEKARVDRTDEKEAGELPHARPTLEPKRSETVPREEIRQPFNMALFQHEDPFERFSTVSKIRDTIYGGVSLAIDRRGGDRVVIKRSKRPSSKCLENPFEEIRLMQCLQRTYQSAESSSSSRSPVTSASSDAGGPRRLHSAASSGGRGVYAAAHPGLVRLLGAYRVEDGICTAFEYMGGGDLFDAVASKKGSALPEPRARDLFAQVCEAVSFMHRCGICHLDISPENILLDEKRAVAKLCDLGMARELRRAKFDPRDGCPGKRSYRAPEIFSREPFDGARCDVFSLGVVLFVMTVGSMPFRDPNSADPWFDYIQRVGVRPLMDKFKPGASAELSNLVRRMLEANDRKRISMRGVLKHPWMTGGAEREGEA